MRKQLSIIVLTALFFIAVFIPSFHLFQPFHLFMVLIPFVMIFTYITKNQLRILIIILIIFLLSFIYSIYKDIYNLADIATAYSFLPFLLLCYIIFVTMNIELSKDYIYNILKLVFFLLAILIILQIIGYRGSFMEIYFRELERSRLGNLQNYIMIYAPFENKNTVAYVFGLLILFFIYNHDISEKRNNVIDMLLISILFLGLLFSFARTIIIAFIISTVALSIIFKKKQILIYLFFLTFLAITVYIIIVGVERVTAYYLTILYFNEDYSFLERFKFWKNIQKIIVDNPLSLFVGFAAYKKELMILQNNTYIDSGILYMLINNGAAILISVFMLALNMCYRYKAFFPFFLYIVISNITLAIITDYRCVAITGMILGILFATERKRKYQFNNEVQYFPLGVPPEELK